MTHQHTRTPLKSGIQRRVTLLLLTAVLCLSACDDGTTAQKTNDTDSTGEKTSDAEEKPVSISGARLPPWPSNAKGAYSIIHDDFCVTSGIIDYAIPELEKRGLRAGLATIASTCKNAGLVDRLKTLTEDGFEIINHSMTHDYVTPENAEKEIFEARQLLEQYTGVESTFFAFPFDSFSAETVALVSEAGYLGARAGSAEVNAPDFSDPLLTNFDAFGMYSAYGDGLESLNKMVDEALEIGGWAVRECHGVEDNSWEPVPLVDYKAHLDYVEALVESNDLWIDVPTQVIRYRFARECLGIPSFEGNQFILDNANDCDLPARDMTVAVSFESAPEAIIVRVDDIPLPTKKIDTGEWIFDVPVGKPVLVSTPIP